MDVFLSKIPETAARVPPPASGLPDSCISFRLVRGASAAPAARAFAPKTVVPAKAGTHP